MKDFNMYNLFLSYNELKKNILLKIIGDSADIKIIFDIFNMYICENIDDNINYIITIDFINYLITCDDCNGNLEKYSTNKKNIIYFSVEIVLNSFLKKLPDNLWIIHGSFVSISNSCYIFSGKTCSGKSTLSFELYKKGVKYLSDDIGVIDTYNKKCYPLYKPIYLRDKFYPGVDKINKTNLIYMKTDMDEEKIAIIPEINKNVYKQFYILKSIFLLDRNNKHEITELTPVESKNKLISILKSSKSGLNMTHNFNSALRILKDIDLFIISYPSKLEAIDDIIKILYKKENEYKEYEEKTI